MTLRDTPPFRADHVGSLLRPPELLQAREDHAAGRIDDDELRAAEDDAIRDVVRMQRDVGLRSATDGEFRRTAWHMDFIYQLGGVGKSDEMVSKARGLYEDLRRRNSVEYDDNGAIGRRYRRQDEIGTPWAFTIDEQTLADDTVTVRDRDSLAQERLPLSGIAAWLDDALARPWVTPKGD